MPSIIEPWSRRHKRSALLITGLAVALFFAVGGFLAYHSYVIARDNQEYASAQKIAQLDAASRRYDLAAGVWNTYAAKSPSRDHRYQAYLQAAAFDITGGQYAAAAASCRQAEKLFGVTFQEAEVAATAYARLGQNQAAIGYYRQAIKLEPASYSDAPADKADFARAITQLGGRP